MEGQVIPKRIYDAVCTGGVAEVEEWLASLAAPRDVVNVEVPIYVGGNATLLFYVTFGMPFGASHAELVRLLISHGANVNQLESLSLSDGASPLHNLLHFFGPDCSGKAVIDAVKSLLSAGAEVNRDFHGRFPITVVIEKLAKRLYPDSAVIAEVVTMLLRAGASVDSSSGGKLSGWQTMRQVHATAVRCNDDYPWRANLLADPHFITIKAQIDGVHAHGSWRAYIMAPRLEVLTLRGLANRGKIRSADPALNNLVALPNELICQVLAFWIG